MLPSTTNTVTAPTTFRLAVLKLWVHLYNKLYLLVSAVDPQESGMKCYVTIHTGRMTVQYPHSVECDCDIVMINTS